MIKVVIILILILLFLLLLVRFLGKKETGEIGGVTLGVIDLPSDFDVQSYVNSIVEEGMFQVFINTNIILDGNNKANLLIQNSEKNKYPAFVEFITDDENQELLYKSSVISPGYKIETAELPNDLADGIHPCKAYFHLLDDAGKEVNKVAVNVKISKGDLEEE